MPPPTWRRLDAAHACWPAGWRDLADPPAAVYVTGDAVHLSGPAVAVVGTRRATTRGLAVTARLGRDLAARGWTIVSGLALGIDAEAHRAALAAGGVTVAVMATSPERTYPTVHRDLRRKLEAHGCSITEVAPGEGGGQRWCFPRRNRIIAAHAAGVVVVEAPRRSGALVTARLAADLGRPVFAVPGPVDEPVSAGCHDLLRDGAFLCTGAADIDTVLAPPRPAGMHATRSPQPVPGSAARWILDRLALEGTDLEDLRRRWPGTDAMWSEGLLALELADLIRRLPGARAAPRIWHA
jgi:DNA processing protein